MAICPFCKRDPFHYIDNGEGMEPVAVDCCDAGSDACSQNRYVRKVARQILRFRRSGSPRKKARAARLWREHYPDTAPAQKRSRG